MLEPVVAALKVRRTKHGLQRVEVSSQIDPFISKIQFVSRRAAMLLNRVNSNLEHTGDLFTGQAALHEVTDLNFAGSQLEPVACDSAPER